MSNITELEQYLKLNQVEGQQESSGEFTLERNKALKKLAGFQLPYKHAWAVKLVQSMVAGTDQGPIKIKINSASISFQCSKLGFSLEEFVSAFYNPSLPPNRSLQHAITGLRTVSLSQNYSFQIAFSNSQQSLVWDGQDLKQVKSKQASYALITLVPPQSDQTQSWMQKHGNASRRNSGIASVLSDKCCISPLAIIVDGRRLELPAKLEFKDEADLNIPIHIGTYQAQDTKLANFKVCSASFPRKIYPFLTSRLPPSGATKFNQNYQNSIKSLSSDKEVALIYRGSLNYHANVVVDLQKKRSIKWSIQRQNSTLNWVLDGAIIKTSSLLKQNQHASLEVFVSAQGLETDLSTLNLSENSDYSDRLGDAYKALYTATAELESLTTIKPLINRTAYLVSVLAFLVSLISFLVSKKLNSDMSVLFFFSFIVSICTVIFFHLAEHFDLDKTKERTEAAKEAIDRLRSGIQIKRS